MSPRRFPTVIYVSETDKEIHDKAEISGVDPKDADISLIGSQTTIKGEKKAKKEEKSDGFKWVEQSFGGILSNVHTALRSRRS